MNNKITVGILCGGKSAEHEVSLQSAKNVAEAINKDKYDVVLIGIDKTGRWLLPDQSQFLLNDTDPKLITLNHNNSQVVSLVPQSNGVLQTETGATHTSKIDVIFPILHGPFGEDGTVQGLFKLVGVPFVGAGVLGSAVGMDKDIMKRLLRDAGIPIGKFRIARADAIPKYEDVADELGETLFIKPANLGSSVGVSKVTNDAEYVKAVAYAFQYDRKVIIEEAIIGRELECAVAGNEDPKASVVGEVVMAQGFYSYDAKYIESESAHIEIPAKISPQTMTEAQALAVQVFQTLACEGIGRVDMFLKENGELMVNEINTIPGFTSISMYPKLWEASGISYTDLIDKLIQLAIERFEKEQQLKTAV